MSKMGELCDQCNKDTEERISLIKENERKDYMVLENKYLELLSAGYTKYNTNMPTSEYMLAHTIVLKKLKGRMDKITCPNCGEEGLHFATPSLGEEGFYICEEKPEHKPCENCKQVSPVVNDDIDSSKRKYEAHGEEPDFEDSSFEERQKAVHAASKMFGNYSKNEQEEKIYSCDNCDTMRTKSEGGATFTICDKCWNKLHPEYQPEHNNGYNDGRERNADADKQRI